MPPGSETIIQQWGAFGAVFVMILVPLGTYAWRQTQKLNEVQASRVQDAKDVRDVLLQATRDFSSALQEQTRLATETEGASANIIEKLDRIDQQLRDIENSLNRGPSIRR